MEDKQVCRVIDEEIKNLEKLLCSFGCSKCRVKA
jgi:hypothetical protein